MRSKMTKKIYVVILNYNGWKDTIECLESVFESDFKNYQVVVVDNNSSDNSMDHIREWADEKLGVDKSNKPSSQYHKPFNYVHYTCQEVAQNSEARRNCIISPSLTLIQTIKNGGFAYGNNIGITFALNQNDFSYIWLLNNDTAIYPDTMASLITSFEQKRKDRNVGVLGNMQHYYHQPDKIQAIAGGFDKWKARVWNIGDSNSSNHTGTTPLCFQYIYGASMVISKECIDAVGLLNEKYFMYFEEIDYAERAKKKGFELSVCNNISILHKYRATVSKQNDTFREYYLRRNIIIFYKLYYPHLVVIPLLKIVLIMLKKSFKNRRVETLYLRILKESLFEYFK
jgi:GT2 family glycosyltransferase